MRGTLSFLFASVRAVQGSSPGLGEYIRNGLGVTEVDTETVVNTVTASSQSGGNSSYASLNQCASSWASYDSVSSSEVTLASSISTSYYAATTSITLGTGDVYTTKDGFPVASGNFTPTKVVKSIFNITTTNSAYYSTTLDPAKVSATPGCSSVSPSDCSLLYVSYLNSLGLSSNADVPKITPAPTNSPGCPSYYYKSFTSCSYWTDDVNTCYVSGENVQVFYFPSKTVDSSATITDIVVQSYAPGITFTSPSVYLSFDYLSAISSIGALESACTTCGPGGCSMQAVGGGDGLEYRGTKVAGALLSFPPEAVSTLLVSYPPAEATRVASVIAHGALGYQDLAADVNYAWNLTAKRLDFNSFVHPAPTDYYLRPRGAPGCNSSIPSPQCSTMFEDSYRPILSLPSEVSLLQGAWATCIPAIYGVYDPPVALTEVSTIAGPTLPQYPGHSTTKPSATAIPITVPSHTQPKPTSNGSPQTGPNDDSGNSDNGSASQTGGNSDDSNSDSTGDSSNGQSSDSPTSADGSKATDSTSDPTSSGSGSAAATQSSSLAAHTVRQSSPFWLLSTVLITVWSIVI